MNKILQAIILQSDVLLDRYPTMRWLPMILLMMVIFWLSSRQTNQLPDMGWLDFVFKKGAHMVGYAMLGIFCYWGTRHWASALIITILYAVTDEVHQAYVPTRNGQISDVLIDSTGAFIGCVLYHYWMEPRFVALRQKAAVLNNKY